METKSVEYKNKDAEQDRLSGTCIRVTNTEQLIQWNR